MTDASPDYYRVLGVDYGASVEEIEKAYHELARKLHPDLTGDDPELTARYMAVNEAYQTLSRPALRSAYDLELGIEERPEGGGTAAAKKVVHRSDSPAEDMRLLDAKLMRSVKEAERLTKRGSFWEATRLLEKYLKTHPESTMLRKALASAALGRKSYHEAVSHMKVVCKVEYHNPDNFVELAGIYVEAGQFVLAEKALREAFGWNASHEGARKMQKRIRDLMDAEKPPLQRIFTKISRALGRGEGDD